MRRLLTILFFSTACAIAADAAAPAVRDGAASVKVECTRTSAFIRITIEHDRRIGNIVIEVKNKAGLTLYREEGRALDDVLVRRLDKGVFPREELILSVTGNDLQVSQPFSVQ